MMQPKYQPEAGHPNGMRVERAAFAETAPVSRKREPVRWGQLAPYLVACVAVAVAVAVLAVVLAWRTALQAQVSQLRHEGAATQSQLASAADAGGSQIARLNAAVSTLRGEVNALDGLAAYTGTCTTDATSSNGRLAVYAVPCRP
jgi:anti-sigma-K factor RskA